MQALPEFLTRTPEFAAWRPTRGGSVAQISAWILGVIRWCLAEGVEKLVIDLRYVPELPSPDTMERFALSSQAADLAAGVLAVAMVVPQRVQDPAHFGSTVAQNRGLRVRSFTDEVEGLRWLVGPEAIRPVLNTERLLLRWLLPSDAPFILELTTQPSWLRNIGDRGVRDLPTAEGYIRNGPVASYQKHGFGLWCVARHEDAQQVGICGIIRRDTMDHPELAYAMLERFHGHGYGSEAALATMRYAQGALGIPTLLAIVDPENAASIRILEKAGMTYQRPITMPGEEKAISLYST